MAAAEDMFRQGGMLRSPHNKRSFRVSMYEIAAPSPGECSQLCCRVAEGEGTPAEVALSGATRKYDSIYPVYLYSRRSTNGASLYPLTPFCQKNGRRVAIFATAKHVADDILRKISLPLPATAFLARPW